MKDGDGCPTWMTSKARYARRAQNPRHWFIRSVCGRLWATRKTASAGGRLRSGPQSPKLTSRCDT